MHRSWRALQVRSVPATAGQQRDLLAVCCCSCRPPIVSRVLERVLDLDAKSANEGNSAEQYHRPLHFAARFGQAQTLEILLRRKALMNATTRDQGWAPLHLAAADGHQKVVSLLLSKKAPAFAAGAAGGRMAGKAAGEAVPRG